MSKKKLPRTNENCLRSNACAAWQYFKDGNPTEEFPECERCGWNVQEDAFRKDLPLTLCPDGLRRKLIPPRHHLATAETEAGTDD